MKIRIERKCLDTNENEIGCIDDFNGSLLEFYKYELNKVEVDGEFEVHSTSYDQTGFHVILFNEKDGSNYSINYLPLPI